MKNMIGQAKGENFLEEIDREPRVKKIRKNAAGQKLAKFGRSKGMQIVFGITMVILMLYAVFAFLYTSVVLYYSGVKTSFLWFWPTTFFISCAAAIGLFLVLRGELEVLRGAAVVLTFVFWSVIFLLGGIFTRVYTAGQQTPRENADYVIILGAQVRGMVPSLVLDARIRCAADYLKENPEAIAVASGGQGSGEMVSEAEAIRQGLLRLGIAADRILLEDKSTSTLENIRFSAEVIAAQEAGDAWKSANTVIVTNDFHVYRATRLAKKSGFTQVSGCGAPDTFAVTIQYYVRECIGVVLEFLRRTV